MADQASNPELENLRKFAARLGCSVATARRLCVSRKIASVRYSRTILVPVSEAQRLIESSFVSAITEQTPASVVDQHIQQSATPVHSEVAL